MIRNAVFRRSGEAIKPIEKAQKISDGGSHFLFVPPNGSKLWRFSYTFAGKQKTLALRSYPAISLAEARADRDAAKVLLSKGVDPGEQKKLDAIGAALARATTFEVVAAELLDKKKREGRALRTSTHSLNDALCLTDLGIASMGADI